MAPVSMEMAGRPGDYLIITLKWWVYQSMHKFWEFDQSLGGDFAERKGSGSNGHLIYVGSYLTIPKGSKQRYIKKPWHC